MKISTNSLLLIQIKQIQFLFSVVIVISTRLKEPNKFLFIKEKKKVFTVILSVNLGGKVLSIQSVQKGVPTASLSIIVIFEKVKRRDY